MKQNLYELNGSITADYLCFLNTCWFLIFRIICVVHHCTYGYYCFIIVVLYL